MAEGEDITDRKARGNRACQHALAAADPSVGLQERTTMAIRHYRQDMAVVRAEELDTKRAHCDWLGKQKLVLDEAVKMNLRISDRTPVEQLCLNREQLNLGFYYPAHRPINLLSHSCGQRGSLGPNDFQALLVSTD